MRAISSQLRLARTTIGTKECLRLISRKTRRRSVSLTSISVAERIQRRRDVAGLLGDDDEVIVLSVFGERDAEAIEDPPAQRRQQPQVDAVFVGENRVAVRFRRSAAGTSARQWRRGAAAWPPARSAARRVKSFWRIRLPPHCRRSARAHQRALAAAQQKARDREDRDGQHRAENRVRGNPAILRQAASAMPRGPASPRRSSSVKPAQTNGKGRLTK